MEVAGAAVATFERPTAIHELLATVTGISTKELTRNLRELAAAKLVAQDTGIGQVARYDLTVSGKSLMPMFKELLSWGTTLLASR